MNSFKEKLPGIILLVGVAYIATTIAMKDPLFFKRPFESHYHDGTYILDKSMMGMKVAWVIDGSELTVYSTVGGARTMECNQYRNSFSVTNNRITESYFPDDKGDFVISQNKMSFMGMDMDMEVKMVLVDFGTDYKYREIMTLLDTAYSE